MDENQKNLINNLDISTISNYSPAFNNLYTVEILQVSPEGTTIESSEEDLNEPDWTKNIAWKDYVKFHATQVTFGEESLKLERNEVTRKFHVVENSFKRSDVLKITWRESDSWKVKKYHENWLSNFYDKETDSYQSYQNKTIARNILTRIIVITLPSFSYEENSENKNISEKVIFYGVMPLNTGNLSLSWSNSPNLIQHEISYCVESWEWNTEKLKENSPVDFKISSSINENLIKENLSSLNVANAIEEKSKDTENIEEESESNSSKVSKKNLMPTKEEIKAKEIEKETEKEKETEETEKEELPKIPTMPNMTVANASLYSTGLYKKSELKDKEKIKNKEILEANVKEEANAKVIAEAEDAEKISNTSTNINSESLSDTAVTQKPKLREIIPTKAFFKEEEFKRNSKYKEEEAKKEIAEEEALITQKVEEKKVEDQLQKKDLSNFSKGIKAEGEFLWDKHNKEKDDVEELSREIEENKNDLVQIQKKQENILNNIKNTEKLLDRSTDKKEKEILKKRLKEEKKRAKEIENDIKKETKNLKKQEKQMQKEKKELDNSKKDYQRFTENLNKAEKAENKVKKEDKELRSDQIIPTPPTFTKITEKRPIPIKEIEKAEAMEKTVKDGFKK